MASYRDTAIALSPTHYWRLDEPSGTNANDEIGTLDGTYVNTPTLGATGLIAEGSAVTFSRASTQRMTIPDHADLKGMTSYSLVMVIKLTANIPVSPGNSVFLFAKTTGGEGDVAGEWSWRLEDQSGAAPSTNMQLATIWHNGTGAVFQSVSGWQPVVGTRYHMAMIWTGSAMRWYINGSQQGTDQATTGTIGSTDTSVASLASSNQGADRHMDVTVDEVAFWKNTALTGTNVSDLYAAMDNPPVPPTEGVGIGYRRLGRHRGRYPARDFSWY